jgi:hypothetical protein
VYFKSGRKISHTRLRNGVKSFGEAVARDLGISLLGARQAARADNVIEGPYAFEIPIPFSDSQKIDFGWDVLDSCE